METEATLQQDKFEPFDLLCPEEALLLQLP